MSDHDTHGHSAVATADAAHEAPHAAEHTHGTTQIIVDNDDDDEEPSWLIRLGLAVGGILLLAAALAVWQMQGRFGGDVAIALPWLIFGAVILAAAAIVGSITTEVWVTVIGGIFLLAAAYIVTGRVNVQLDQQSHAAYIVDRFTGEVRICSASGCHDLPGFGGPSVNVKMPTVDAIKRSVAKPAPAH